MNRIKRTANPAIRAHRSRPTFQPRPEACRIAGFEIAACYGEDNYTVTVRTVGETRRVYMLNPDATRFRILQRRLNRLAAAGALRIRVNFNIYPEAFYDRAD